MASYHCTVKVGSKGRAGPHALYIARDGKYADAKQKSRREDLECKSHGNMPNWATKKPNLFWQAADEHERANGATYREIEIALPRELTPEQRRALVEDFVQQEIGIDHAYQWAIHIPRAALEKGEQPHAHIMYSERTTDGIERDPEQYFKRYNAKTPGKGGCKKDSAGTPERLQVTRERVATLTNVHLERAGHATTVDHRSLKAQGIDRLPEKHIGPVTVRQMAELEIAALLERRGAEGELQTACQELSTIDVSGDLKTAVAERDEKINQLKEVNDLRRATFASIANNVRAASGYCQALESLNRFTESDLIGAFGNVETASRDSRAIEAIGWRTRENVGQSRDSLHTAGKYLQAATGLANHGDRDPGRVEKTIGRRRSESDYGRVVGASVQQFKRASHVIQHAGRHLEDFVRTIAASCREIWRRIEAAKALEALRKGAPVSPQAKPEQLPVGSASPGRDMSHLDCLKDDQKAALSAVKLSIVRASEGDQAALDTLPAMFLKFKSIADDMRAIKPPLRQDEAIRAAGAADSQRDDAARVDVNRQALARNITDMVPYPPEARGLFVAAHHTSFESYLANAAKDLQYQRYHVPRPDVGMLGNASKQKAWDEKEAGLNAAVQRVEREIAWRDKALLQAKAARVAQDAAQIAQHARDIADLIASDASDRAAGEHQQTTFKKEVLYLRELAEKMLTSEQKTQLERGLENIRVRSRGVSR
uniref:Conjugal transfer MobA/MobL relaxase n=1 Tax=Polaromonas sp. H1N TaxID=1840283 RepID=A0A2S1FI56_9BURK|nr:MobA/MobL family protein [Polaromonas sp. H1N]AWD72182.1 conjugal transfer MobA/MobL relaxase [Polaromonas sp. H1N]